MNVVFGKLDVTAKSFVNVSELIGAGLLLRTGELVFRGSANGGPAGLWQINRKGEITRPESYGPVISLGGARWLFEPRGEALSNNLDLSVGQIVFEGPGQGWGLILAVSDSHIAYWNFTNSGATRSSEFTFSVFASWRLTAVSEDDSQRVLVTITSDTD